jgi:hypothetical protein
MQIAGAVKKYSEKNFSGRRSCDDQKKLKKKS